jgi:hypothetical protein
MNATTDESFRGVGKKMRRVMVKLWKESGSGKSLKAWAADSQVGDAAAVWIASKRKKLLAGGSRCVRRAMVNTLKLFSQASRSRPDARLRMPESMLNSLEVGTWTASVERRLEGVYRRHDFDALIESLDWLKKVVRKARESDVSDAWNMFVVREIQEL